MALVSCRHCREAVDAAHPDSESVRGWGVLCPDCESIVEVVRDRHGRFTSAYVRGDDE
ncbi:hypothetical protein [Halogeometricum borinquense]|uniref:hypothetical protein n=1 Tax=Halogeometricum borinquense TaxID=60847 RepID=UPI0013EA6321|nr:hypothetical protein [Halogeometricum borinquense]